MRLKIICLAAAVSLSSWVALAQNDTLSTSHTVGKEQMNKGLVTSGLGALQGQAAGVTVSGANQSAMLGAVRVRGTTSLTGGEAYRSTTSQSEYRGYLNLAYEFESGPHHPASPTARRSNVQLYGHLPHTGRHP